MDLILTKREKEIFNLLIKNKNTRDISKELHISEIDNNYIKDINKYVKVGDDIYANVIGVDDATKHLKLSIKNMNYNDNNHGKRTIKENIKGFLPLHNKLDEWIKDTLKDMNEK